MVILISALLVAVASALCIPIAAFCLEIVAAVAAGGRSRQPGAARGRCAVLVPAHDEALMLGGTLANLKSELRPGDRILVVADNCSDATAAVAATAGAEVVERFDRDNKGKSFALDFGLRALAFDPPDAVVMVDADCRLAPGGLDRLVSTCLSTGRPAQGCYLILAPAGAGASVRLAEFAQIVKNRLRPRGLQALGLPCHLAGSGMAFPWAVACAVDFRNGAIVEDLRLGLDFAAAGHPPIFCSDVDIVSYFPASRTGASAQRQRWQHGHLQVIAACARDLPVALLRRDVARAALTLDLCVPPLTMLALMIGTSVVVSAAALALGASWVPLAISSTGFVALLAATLAAWRISGQPSIPLREAASLAAFIRERVLLYPRLLSRRPAQWIRTDRSGQA